MTSIRILFFILTLVSPLLQAADPARVLIVVGPTNHPPGTHEVAAGGRLMQHCLQNMSNVPGVKAEVVEGWPAKELRDAASSVVFIGDIFPPNQLPEPQRNLAELDEMMKRGCGIVCVHYATGLEEKDVAEDGDHPLLRWMGGYFATRCKHHQSVAKVFQAATISPAAEHPINRGWKQFTLHDEPYINNYFGKDGNRPATNVTVLATSLLPPEAPERETVAWCVDRPDGGRGFGNVMPHYYRNWTHEDLRRFILNGIVWTAKLEVPAEGVKTETPDLAAFNPGSLTPQPSPKKPQSAAATADISRAELLDRIHGGWAGMLIGGLEGLPHEFKYKEQPRDTLPDFTFLEKGARSDDDNDFEWPHLFFMDKEGVIKLPYPRIVEIWKANMNSGIWIANKQARELMEEGVLPPETGTVAGNPAAWYNLSDQTLQYAMALGYDADCNAATAGVIVGVRRGFKHISTLPQFKMPDHYVNKTRPQLPAECKVSEQAETLLRVAERVILANGGENITIAGQPGYRVKLQQPRLIEPLPEKVHGPENKP